MTREHERSLPLRAGHPMRKALTARGFVARLVVTRKDGKPLTADDQREVDATVHAYEGMDKIVYTTFAKKTPAKKSRVASSAAENDTRPSKRKAAKKPTRARSK